MQKAQSPHSPHRSTVAERFWPNVNMTDGCWLWTGQLINGYGRISDGRKKNVLAHRHSYEIHKGPIADGMFVCHTCDVKHCVNPSHLFAGTQGDNMRDAVEKGIMARKLTWDDVRAIRRKHAAGGITFAALAREYSIVPQMAEMIVKRQTWKHDPLEEVAA